MIDMPISENIFSFITLLGFILFGYTSFYYYKKDNLKLAIACLMLGGFILRWYAASDFFLHPWDERYHALVAKNLMENPFIPTLYKNPILSYDPSSWNNNHIWLHKQPLPLWTMSLSMLCFGTNELALRFPSILLSTLTIVLTYIIGSYWYNKKIGYLAGFFFAINGLIIELSAGRVATDHIDIFFLFFITLGIVCMIKFVEKQHYYFLLLTGLSMGAAILTKWMPALIILPLAIVLMLDTQKLSVKQIITYTGCIIIPAIVVFLPWQLYIYKYYPYEASWEAGFNMKHVTDILEGHGGPWYYYLDRIRINYGELIYLPLIWILWLYSKSPFHKKHIFFIVWIFIPIFFFSYAKTKMQAYILFTAPAFFIITAAFFYWLYDYSRSSLNKRWYQFILALLLVLPLRYMIERVKPFSSVDRHPAWVKELQTLTFPNPTKSVLLNYPNSIEAMFYTPITAYAYIPEKTILNQLLNNGYTIYIYDNGAIDQSLKSISGIHIIRLKTPS